MLCPTDGMFDSRADGNLLLFFKYYDPINETIKYRGHRVLHSANVVRTRRFTCFPRCSLIDG